VGAFAFGFENRAERTRRLRVENRRHPNVPNRCLPVMGTMRECPSCALTYEDDGQDECPYCGYEIPRQRRSVKWVAWILVAIMVWFALQELI
jgi:uncharacterized paraquat-inducible protein A